MPGPRLLRLRTCVVDLDQQRVRHGDAVAALTGQETAVLGYLAERHGRVVSREALYSEVLGYTDGTRSRALDAAIRRIRNKIEADPTQPDHLLTIYGEGYRLVTEAAPEVAAAPSPSAVPAGRGDRFVGRAAEVARVRELLAQRPSLVTVHGPGGVGKSRLVYEVLGGTGVRIDVAPGATEEALEAAVAGALEVAAASGVARALAARAEVLVLESAEASLEAVVGVLAEWWATGDGLAVVVTSREPLRLAAECVVGLDPLGEGEALELLRDRATGALGGRPWPGADEPALRELARALDGLPLALELAAGRAPVLSPAAVLERLHDRFTLLRSTRRDTPLHHTTLWGTLQASWELLDDGERAALVQLGAFLAPFVLAAAEAVVEGDALELVQGLVRRSLLRPADARGRLCMLDSVRAFVLEQATSEPWAGVLEEARRRLAERGHRVELGPEDRRQCAERALELGLASLVPAVCAAVRALPDAREGVALAERARRAVQGPGLLAVAGAATPALVRAAPANVTEAWIEALDALDEGDEVERLATTGRLLAVRGDHGEAVRRLEQALSLASEERRPALLVSLGEATWAAGHTHRSREVLEEARAAYEPGSAPWARATVRLSAAVRAVDRDPEASEALLREGYEAHQALEQPAEAALALGNLGNALVRRGDLRGAVAHLEGAIEVLERHGDLRTAAVLRKSLALAWDQLGIGEPLRAVGEAARIHRRLGDRRNEALAVGLLASMQARRDRADEAREAVERALRAVEEVAPPLVPVILMYRAQVLDRVGDAAGVEASLARAVDLLPPEGGEAQIELGVLLNRAELCAERHPERSAADLEHVRRLYVRLRGAEELSAQWHVAAARVALARGQGDVAREQVARARARLEALTVEPTAWMWQELDTLTDQASR